MPHITDITVNEGTLSCVFHDTNVSLPNALRRTILSKIPCIVIDTSREGANELSFQYNDTSQTNEMLAQRLAAIPVHETNVDFPWRDYYFQIDVENKTEDSMMITSGDIMVYRRDTSTRLDKAERERLFPRDPFTGDYIDLASLSGLSGTPRSNRLQIKGYFTIGTASDNGSYAVATEATCTGLQDKKAAARELKARVADWKAKGLSSSDIGLRSSDFNLLDAHRYVVPNTFVLTVSSVGVFTPEMLMTRGCSALTQDLAALATSITEGNNIISPSNNTIADCYDATISSNSNTVGRLLESVLFSEHYARGNTLSYCGFVKPHPHHEHAILRYAFNPDARTTEPAAFLLQVIQECSSQLDDVARMFSQ